MKHFLKSLIKSCSGVTVPVLASMSGQKHL